MIIANPIYDVVFKHLMENKKIAKFFIETLIGEKVEDIGLIPQEYTYKKTVKTKEEEEKEKKEEKKEEKYVVLSILRYDFVATIRTANGENKKILIEVQKSDNSTDLARFRKYLGVQYIRKDMIEVATGKIEKSLPITCIYLLGFTIPEIGKIPAIKVNRTYIDMIGQKEIKQKSKWIEGLTHDGYFVQIPYVEGTPRTALEKLLSIFEQKHFVDDKNMIKEYEYPVDDENIKEMLDILGYVVADEKTRREMDEAWWAAEKEREYEQELEDSKKIILEQGKALEGKDKTIEKQGKVLEAKDKALEAKDKTIEAKDKALAEKDELIKRLQEQINKQNNN